MICGRHESTGVVTIWDMFYLSCLMSQTTCNLGYGLVTYFDTMSNKSRGALCGGCYINRLAKNLGVFTTLRDLTKSYYMVVFDMDTFHLMHFMKKRDDVYVLIDGASPGKGVPKVAEDHDAPVPNISASKIPPIFPIEALARIEVSQ